MQNITRKLLTHPVSRPSLRNPVKYRISEVKAIVIHWTANTAPTATAINNRNYFNLGSRPASAHYIVDDHSVVQCLPETEVGYHCGDKPLGQYKPAGKALIKGTKWTPNYFTLGVEMCVNEGSEWETILLETVSLTAVLILKYKLEISSLFRHFDITGKLCPRPLLDDGVEKTSSLQKDVRSLRIARGILFLMP